MQQLGPAWKALCWTLESGFLCSLFSQLAFGKPQKIKKPKGNKDAGSRICTSRTAGETSPPCQAECCSLGMKMSTVVLGLFVCLDSTPVKWLCDCLPLLSCPISFYRHVDALYAKSIIHGSRRRCSSAESRHLRPVVTFERLPDRSADACSRKRPKASGDYVKQETKPRDPSKRLLWIWSDAARRQAGPHQAARSSLTYDDVRLARAGTGVGAKVALDLVGSLIEQIQVVFHRVSIVKALAQTDNTWCRGRRRFYPSSMLIY